MFPPQDRRSFLRNLAAGGVAWSVAGPGELVAASGRPHAAPAVDALRPLSLDRLRIQGRLGDRVDACVRHRILAQEVEHLVAPFRTRTEDRWWQTEFWGKWFLSAVDAARYSRDPAAMETVRAAARALMETQTADGYIGNYAPDKHLEGWDVWGRKYTLLGLLAYHDLSGDRDALRAARRLADHLLTELGPGRAEIVRTGFYRGMASSSVLEPMVHLYRRTSEPRYLDFARYIVQSWEGPDGPKLISRALAGVPVAQRFPAPERWWSWENGQKAYEMMSCYEGLLELYRVDARPEYLEAAVRSWESIRDTEINVAGSGASMECWYGGRARQTEQAKHMMESCVTMTWMQFNQNLLRLTGDPRYADEIERSGYNALLAAMTPDGSWFAQYTPLDGYRKVGQNLPPDMRLNCCVANGPRGVMLIPETAVMASAEGPVVNLYAPGTARVPLDDVGEVEVIQSTAYPAESRISIRVRPARPAEFTLSLRIPAWSEATTLAVDGVPVAARPGEYARLRRRWTGAEEVVLELDLRTRLEEAPGRPDRVALLRGPLLLALPPQGGLAGAVATPVVGEDGYVNATRADPTGHWVALDVPFENGVHDASGTLRVVDFASAGGDWSEGEQYRVWLERLHDPSRRGA